MPRGLALIAASWLVLAGAAGDPAAASSPPVVDSFTASPASVAPGGIVDLQLDVHDPDCADTCTSGCGLYISASVTSWSATGGTFLSVDKGVSASPYTTTAQWLAPETEGIYTISVYVGDSGSFMCGGRGSITPSLDIQVTSSTSEPPVVQSVTANPARLYPGQSSDLACIASDPEGDPIVYTWSSDLGAITDTGGGTAVFTMASPGVATITCTATDPSDRFGTGTVGVSVNGAVADRMITAALGAPRRLDVDSQGYVYVVDRQGGGIVVLDLLTGDWQYRIPLPGVTSVAVDWNGDLIVGEVGGARVLDRSGTERQVLVNSVNGVMDVAADGLNQRYAVLHRGTGRVQVFDAAGTEFAAFGANGEAQGQFKGARGLAAGTDGQWVVADTGHGLVQVFDASGTFVRAFGGLGGGAAEFVRLEDVAVGGDGVVYATDSYQDWVQAFNPNGSPRETLGAYGAGLGEFMTATGVATADGLNRLVAASLNSSSLQVFRTSDEPVQPPIDPGADLAPANLVFGEVLVGTESAVQTASLTNTGSAPLGIQDIALQGAYVQASDCGPVIEPGQTCGFQISFRPGNVGLQAGSLILTTSAQPARRAVSLAGTGIAPTPGMTVAPLILSFADQEAGTISAPRLVTVTNTGTAPLEMGSIAVAGEYIESNDCVGPLAPGASCSIQVQFAPVTVAEAVTGTLTVSSTAPNSPQVVQLSGRSLPVRPVIRIADWSGYEDEAEATGAEFTISLAAPTTEMVQVDWVAVGDEAVEGDDFESASGTVVFQPMETDQWVTVPVVNDDLLEPDEEDFFIELSNPLNADLEVVQAVGTILDEEPCVGPNVLLNPSAEEAELDGSLTGWTEVTGTAWQPRLGPPQAVDGDYYFFSSAVEDAELRQDVDVSAYAKAIDTGLQWFAFDGFVRTLYEAVPDNAQVIIEYRNWDKTTVLDSFDSGPLASPTEWLAVSDLRQAPAETRWIRVRLLSLAPGDAYFDHFFLRSLRAATVVLADATVYEGDLDFQEALFGVQLACPYYQVVETDFVTSDFDALAGEDYLSASQRLNFDVGQTEVTVPVQVIGDTTDEAHEAFLVDLTLVEPTDAVLLDGQGLGIIYNDDFCPRDAAYWRSVPTPDWPVDWLEIGWVTYGPTDLLGLLSYNGRNDESHNLARELVATKLNLARGSKPGTIQPVVDQADLFLASWPPGSKPNGAAAQEAKEITLHLQQYNAQPCP